MTNTLLEEHKYYHIYNHANSNDLLFHEEKNYNYFLGRWNHHISHFTDTLAYCLMPNHFHFLVKIKGVDNSANMNFSKVEETLEKYYSRQFASLFSSYSQSYNKMYKRKGSLFLKNFKRKEIISENYLRQLIIYIHNNPVKHGFIDLPEKWKFSSYQAILSKSDTSIKRNDVIELFDDIDNFIFCHKKQIEILYELQLEE